ncbi:hypothetical protein GN244_ATG04138 [Phytophthora infestans]|uniref:Uncharacterized protein n=1 Tax=Phytophthora infestans TaxID=4787 RepID=A0A833TC33_PHYIN|nr:hypothetical protein GN244_ATG04138 [Phytophthora infestans]
MKSVSPSGVLHASLVETNDHHIVKTAVRGERRWKRQYPYRTLIEIQRTVLVALEWYVPLRDARMRSIMRGL